MREIRTSSLMSGDGRRTAHAAPRPSSTLPVIHCAGNRRPKRVGSGPSRKAFAGRADQRHPASSPGRLQSGDPEAEGGSDHCALPRVVATSTLLTPLEAWALIAGNPPGCARLLRNIR